MKKRSPFPRVFWAANSVEILERMAYYGIFATLYAFIEDKGFSRTDLGQIQSIFLFVSYFIPVFAGTFADRFGFKKTLIVSYIAYIPSILLLTRADTLNGIYFTMLSIGFAAGIFKPLISGTVRLTTDSTNKTLGFGIFYMMVNIGGSIGPIIAAKLKGISWNHAFISSALYISLMFIITLFLYKEPEKEVSKVSIGKKLIEIFSTLSDLKFTVFLVLLGLFFWLPFWGFFNICPAYVNTHIDTISLYNNIERIFGSTLARLLARQENEIWMINGAAIAHTGWIIVFFQVLVSKIFEKYNAIKSFSLGLFVIALGFMIMGYSVHTKPAWVVLGIAVFAFGEMMASPRIQEYITWIAPKEKAGLYMGSNFLSICIAALLSGRYTKLFGYFEDTGQPAAVWYVLALHTLLAILVFFIFARTAGEFKELKH